MAKSTKTQSLKEKDQHRRKKSTGKKSGKVTTPKKSINVEGTDGLKKAINEIHEHIKNDPDYETPDEIIVKPPKEKYSNAEINHEAFVLEYIKTGCSNATAAYQAVYPKVSKKVAGVNGARLLGNASIQQLLKKHLEPIMNKRKIDAEFVFDELAKNLDVCVQREKIKKEERRIKPPLDPNDKNAVEEVEVEVYETTAPYNAKEANKALETLAKCLGMMKDDGGGGATINNNVFIGLPDNGRGISPKEPE